MEARTFRPCHTTVYNYSLGTFLFVLHLTRTWFFRHKKFLASVRACNTIRNTGKGHGFEISASTWVTGCVAGKTPDPSASPEQTQKSEK